MAESLNRKNKFIRGLISGLIGTLLALALWGLGLLETWEANSWDRRTRLLAKPGKATDEIRLILLDQESLNWGEEVNSWPWPWPRQVQAAIIEFCRQSSAKALAFDILYTEFSAYGVDDDLALGSAIADFPNFVNAIYLSEDEGETEWPVDFPKPVFEVSGLDSWFDNTEHEHLLFPRAVLPIPEVARNSDILGNVTLSADFDGVYRRIKLFNIFQDNIFPSLGLGLYLSAQSDTQLHIEKGKFLIGDQTISLDKKGNAIIRYRGPSQTHTAYNAGQILQAVFRQINGEEATETDKAIAADLREKYVLFGYSAPGLFDLRPAPVSGVYPGVEINATVLDNLLSEDFVVPVPLWFTIVLLLGLSSACGMLASLFSKAVENVLIGFVFLGLPLLFAGVAFFKGFWLPFAVQETAAGLTVLASLVINYTTEGRQKRFIKNAFQQYLSPAVIEQLLDHPEHLKLGGELRQLSIFFSDIQGFTTISEALNPEELTALLNEYLSAMTDIILEEGGTIDKYEGDAIIAFWNAPLNVPDHAFRAARAALRCQKSLAELRPVFKDRIGGKEMFMRIGLNTGPAVVGNMGSRSRFDYTMLGDAVNLAARLEGVNKQFGTYSMLSQSTLDLLDNAFAVRELARVAVVGRHEPVTVYEPMFHEEYEARKETLERFVQGLHLFYEGKFEDASQIFTELQRIDPPSASYLKKCEELISHPPENWQGIWVATSK